MPVAMASSWVVTGSSISSLAACAVVVASAIVYVTYALYWHPLARYPGPVLGRLTQWYDVYHAFRGDKHILFFQLHQKYGPIVRFSPNSISINDPEALKAIYSKQNTNVQKSIFYKCFRASPQAVSTLLATDKKQHARKRRVMGQAFNDQALRGLEQYVLQHVDEFMERIRAIVCLPGGEQQAWSETVDMQKYCNWLVFDIMGDLVFGKSFGTLGERPDNRDAIRLLLRAAKRNYVVAAMPALISTQLERWLPWLRDLYLDRNKYLAFGKAQVIARTQDTKLAGETSRRDIFSFLLHAKDPENGEGFPMSELLMEGNTLIVAGSDTTSSTMAATLYYLLRHPHTLRRLEAEVRSTFHRKEDIRMGAELSSCLYLRACIDEAMRLSPAVPGLLPREVLPGGLCIPRLDLQLPHGIDVGVPIYCIQHHEDYVWEPFRFDPSRWISPAEGAESHPQNIEALHAVFTPFSLGNRACLGKPLVYMELGIAIASLVWEFDMKLAKEQENSAKIRKDIRQGRRREDEYHTMDWFLSSNEGPKVVFRQREVVK